MDAAVTRRAGAWAAGLGFGGVSKAARTGPSDCLESGAGRRRKERRQWRQ